MLYAKRVLLQSWICRQATNNFCLSYSQFCDGALGSRICEQADSGRDQQVLFAINCLSSRSLLVIKVLRQIAFFMFEVQCMV